MTTATGIVQTASSSRARDVLGLFKLRIGVLIMVTALVGAMVTAGPRLSLLQWLVLALSVLTASASAGAFNQYYERASDQLMARTRNRAFVTGALVASPFWLGVMAVMLVAAVATASIVLNPVSALFVFLGAFFYGVVYTVWLKRRTAWNIVIGGLAGSFAVLAGAAAVDPLPGAIPLLLALSLFLWTPPHFWSLAIAGKADYAAAGVPMLPVVVGNPRAARIVLASTLALVLTSLLPLLFGAGIVYAIAALGGGGWFVYKAILLNRAPEQRSAAIACFLASLVQLSLLLLAAGLDALM
ncbi:heme o synthase [Dokdonella sp.]|uniref:heme o synthase n=1 Tax=Dokdonella sp. TaxID=2291710 RepID=UPI0025C72625|nr:heme o synthase [Dokdonella sp.]MBX3691705.1 heme o synthase [Dokdonella sp.]MCW5567239.1 heme o synthase [Dokdonella sp.]